MMDQYFVKHTYLVSCFFPTHVIFYRSNVTLLQITPHTITQSPQSKSNVKSKMTIAIVILQHQKVLCGVKNSTCTPMLILFYNLIISNLNNISSNSLISFKVDLFVFNFQSIYNVAKITIAIFGLKNIRPNTSLCIYRTNDVH